jgi:hypothetical protein
MAKLLFQKGNTINKGRIPWNKGTKGLCKPNKSSFGLGEVHHNKPHTEETKNKITEIFKKKWKDGCFDNRPKHSLGTKNKIANTLKELGLNKGEKSQWWKGGRTKSNIDIRRSFDMRLWRRNVFHRDNFTCQKCGVRGVYIEAHHVKSFANFPELRFELSNGITVCLKCHKKIDRHRRLFSKRRFS